MEIMWIFGNVSTDVTRNLPKEKSYHHLLLFYEMTIFNCFMVYHNIEIPIFVLNVHQPPISSMFVRQTSLTLDLVVIFIHIKHDSLINIKKNYLIYVTS